MSVAAAGAAAVLVLSGAGSGHFDSARAAATRYASIVIEPAVGTVHHARRADKVVETPALARLLTVYAARAAIERGEASHAGPQAHAELERAVDALTGGRGDPEAASARIAQLLGAEPAGWLDRLADIAAALDLGRSDVAAGTTTARDLAKLTAALLGDFPSNASSRGASRAGAVPAWSVADTSAPEGFDAALLLDGAGGRLIVIVIGAHDAMIADTHGAELLELAAGVVAAPGRLTPPLLPRPVERPAPQLRRDAPPLLATTEFVSSPTPAVTLAHRDEGPGMVLAAAAWQATDFSPRTEWGDAREPGWRVQIGAFSSVEAAHAQGAAIRAAAPAALEAARLSVEAVEIEGGLLFRARFAGFDRAGAYAACDALQIADTSCFVVEPMSR